MSFPRYPKYKPSGVEWLGEVPEDWTIGRMKIAIDLLTDFTANGSFASLAENVDYLSEGYSRLVRLTDLRTNLTEPGIWVSQSAHEYLKKSELFGGELLAASVGSVGVICRMPYVPFKATLAPNMYLIRINKNITSDEFIYYYLNSIGSQEHIQLISTTTAQPKLNKDNVKNIPLCFPSLPEQTAIAEFLDRETAKIDELVAEQRLLMELLKEKRQAVISHAVTKGLNPHAPMKPSGIEWLGDVADGWEVMPLKHLCVLLKDGTHLPPERVTDGIPLLSVRNLVAGKFVRRDDDSMISEENYRELARAFVPNPEDVLLAIVGATLGKTAVIPSDLGLFHIQRSVAIFRTKPKLLHSVFLNLVFQSRGFQALLWELVGYSAQPGIYLGTLQNIRIPVPPLNEQLAIAMFLGTELAKFDTLTAEAQRAIDLLQERRTALISAAVTGQIDVRQHPKN